MNEEIKELRSKYYRIVRYIAVVIIGPLLICKGVNYNDNILITVGVLLIIWDGIKIYYDR
tara:strand:- start:1548 stop:1727 length:180 start_codon:yes stop_codon:yes gene_type:complete